MGLYDFKPEDILNAQEAFLPIIKKRELMVDKLISKIVGKEVLSTDPKLINLVVKYKRKKNNPDEPDNFLENFGFIKQ